MSSFVPFWNQLPDYARKGLLQVPIQHIEFDSLPDENRLTVLNLYVKMSKTMLWSYILEFIRIDPGRLEFRCINIKQLKEELTRRADFRSPESSMEKWDSAEKCGMGSLHFKHNKQWHANENQVQAHIDRIWVWHDPLEHLITYKSYEDPFGIRDLLISQGFDKATLMGIAVWHCGARDCGTHSEPQHRCPSGVWYCGRIQPACPGHSNPEHRCVTGIKWHCGQSNCPTHNLPITPCPSGTWYCGQVKPPCPGHSRRDDRCATGATLLLFPKNVLQSVR